MNLPMKWILRIFCHFMTERSILFSEIRRIVTLAEVGLRAQQKHRTRIFHPFHCNRNCLKNILWANRIDFSSASTLINPHCSISLSVCEQLTIYDDPNLLLCHHRPQHQIIIKVMRILSFLVVCFLLRRLTVCDLNIIRRCCFIAKYRLLWSCFVPVWNQKKSFGDVKKHLPAWRQKIANVVFSLSKIVSHEIFSWQQQPNTPSAKSVY